MGTGNFTDEFKRDAVAQITEQGYPIKAVSERLGVNLHSLYAWKRKFTKAATGETDKGCRDPSAEARAGARVGGAVHSKKGRALSAIGPRTVASAYFAGDAR